MRVTTGGQRSQLSSCDPRCCRTPLFRQLVYQLQHAFHTVYRDPIGAPQLGTSSLRLHLPLAEAIRDGHSDRAVALMNEIIDLVAEETRIRVGELSHE
ncbi:FCD domain-containing protein [Paracoccus sp. PAR01]|uniref:FCD domain-containing protein n=1 Tax=Paracoccus sp. PAR01 TaxID=2769282 RepID=UPI001CE16F82|nr:FCD domain-containing protein [Paracoccus sp. PAR01]